jgi:thiosulfate dehydrogenase [quinone] large subunit
MRAAGRWFVIALRYLMALFFTGAAINKWTKGWLWSDKLRQVFLERIEEVDPESFGYWFLENVGIPYWKPLAWLVTWGETFCALGLLLGLVTRGAATGAMLLMFAFAIGGYYDASLIVLGLMFLPFVLLPTGHWFGLDRWLHARYPRSIWFR